jgi:hypothetical protein
MQNEFKYIIDRLKRELETVHKEKLTVMHEEKEDINSKHLAALSKIQSADKIDKDMKTDAENTELNKQLDIAGKVEDKKQKFGHGERERSSTD